MCQKEAEHKDGLSWRSGLEEHLIGSSGVGAMTVLFAAQARFTSAG